MNFSALRGRKTVTRVRQKGKKWKGKHMNAFILSRAGSGRLFVGTSVSAKLNKSAVQRNRMRRRCRESLRTTQLPTTTPLSPHRDIRLILLPRSSSLTCDFAELQQDSEALLSTL